jgi:hypothetical protein
VDDLTLQVRQRHAVVVDDAERADPGGGKVLDHRCAEAARADDEDARPLQCLLPRPADLGEHDVPGVALDLLARQAHASSLH